MPLCSMSKSTKSMPVALRIWPMPGVANSTRKVPVLSRRCPIISRIVAMKPPLAWWFGGDPRRFGQRRASDAAYETVVLEQDIADATAIPRQVVEAVEAVETLQWHLGDVRGLGQPEVDGDPG